MKLATAQRTKGLGKEPRSRPNAFRPVGGGTTIAHGFSGYRTVKRKEALKGAIQTPSRISTGSSGPTGRSQTTFRRHPPETCSALPGLPSFGGFYPRLKPWAKFVSPLAGLFDRARTQPAGTACRAPTFAPTFFVLLCLLLVAALPAHAQTQTTASELPVQLEDVGIDQRLGETIPADITLRDEQGNTVLLGDYFGDKPVILALVYYECPMLCSLQSQGLLRSVRALSLDTGTDYRIVTVSFDPGETPDLAAAQKNDYVARYGRDGAEEGWTFLAGDAASIERLTNAVGYRVSYDADTDLYSHASAIMVVTPGRQLSRYFYGIDYPARDLRLALVEASEGRAGSLIDQVLLYCFRYDPAQGRYSLAILNVVRLMGVATVLAIVGFMGLMLRRERRGLLRVLEPQVPDVKV